MVRSLFSPAQLAEVRTCHHCGAALVRQADESPSAFMRRKFCDRACANRWHNAQRKGIPNPNIQGERNGMYGRRHTEAAKEIQRQAALAHPLSAEKQRENALKRIGTKRPQRTRERMAEARRAWWDNATPEQREQHRSKVRKNGIALRTLFSEQRRVWHANLSPAQRLARSERIRTATLAAHPRYAHKFRRTSIECKIAAALDVLSVRYTWNVMLLHRFSVDFLLTDYPVVIECDGDYWHSLPFQQRRDALKNEAIPAAGYRLLRFTESAINTDLQSCVQRIIDTLREFGALDFGQPAV